MFTALSRLFYLKGFAVVTGSGLSYLGLSVLLKGPNVVSPIPLDNNHDTTDYKNIACHVKLTY